MFMAISRFVGFYVNFCTKCFGFTSLFGFKTIIIVVINYFFHQYYFSLISLNSQVYFIDVLSCFSRIVKSIV